MNDFMRAHPDAPSAYPQINNATRALRREAVARGDPHGTNLWAGQGFRLAQARPAAEIVAAIGSELEARAGGQRALGVAANRHRAPGVGTGRRH